MAITSLQPLTELIEARDNLQRAYNEISPTAISQYSMQERQVLYEQRSQIRKEIDAFNRKIALADPTIPAGGYTRADFRNYRYKEDLG
tara:strand:- start:424 stop:687 length:264 start_codon:yes stop_codon:yes gene_type:complete